MIDGAFFKISLSLSTLQSNILNGFVKNLFDNLHITHLNVVLNNL